MYSTFKAYTIILFLSALVLTPISDAYADYKPIPLSFIENKGQVVDQNQQPRNDIQFKLAASGGLNIFIGTGAVHYQFSKADDTHTQSRITVTTGRTHHTPEDQRPAPQPFTMYRMDVELIDANKNAAVLKEQKQDYFENYFSENNEFSAYSYNKVTYKNIYPNIDWVLYLKNGQLKHEFLVHHGGNVADIKIKYGGATGLALDNEGNLVANTPYGKITENTPFTYQKDGTKISSRFVVNNNVLSYEVGANSGEFTIDPGLGWATYYGGNSDDYIAGTTVDTVGIYTTGNTGSVSSIATTGSYMSSILPSWVAFLVKFNSAGVRQWGTYYGCTSTYPTSITTDRWGNIYFAGYTSCTGGIASSGAHATVFGGYLDGFLIKFSKTGSRIWGTYYGGGVEDYVSSIAVDTFGNAYMTGYTISVWGIATTGAYQTSHSGAFNAFLTKFDSAGTQVWGTYFGAGDTHGYSVALDAAGNPYFTGYTGASTGIATAGAYQTTFTGGYGDPFIEKFSSSGARIWGTYCGGEDEDYGNAINVDTSGNIWIAGQTLSTTGIASTGAHLTAYAGGRYDGFIMKFNSTGTARLWGTYYGGIDDDRITSMVTDRSGNVYVAGYTASGGGISTAGAYQLANAGGTYDAFLAKFNAAGVRQWGTFYGGEDEDIAYSMARDSIGHIYIGGSTISTMGISTPGAHQTAFGAGPHDGFLARFDDCTLPSTGSISGLSTVCAGSSITLTPSVTGGAWSASNSNASVATGTVSGITAGTVTISYSFTNTCGTAAATKVITINPLPATITGTVSVCSGLTTGLSSATAGGTWTSFSTSIATIGSSSGIATGAAAGTTAISYTLPTGCRTTTPLTVNPLPAAITGTAAVCVGSATMLATTTTGGSWSTGSTSIATVGTTGSVSGIVAGTEIITYILPTGCINTRIVTVNPLPAAITGTLNVCAGSVTILSDITPSGTWTSGSTTIATVGTTSGSVSALSTGTATISYTLATGCRVTEIVTVNPLPAVITGTTNVCVGTTITLADASSGGTWISGSTSIAAIGSASGIVSGVALGTANITYTLPTGCSISRNITVNPLPAAITGTMNVCNGGATTTLANATPGGTWTSTPTTIATIGSTGIVTSVAAGTATISYTLPTGCAVITIVTVNPIPALTSSLTPPALCDSTVFNYVPTSATPGATFIWSRAAVTGITPASSSGTGNPNELLLNTTTLPITVTYTYTVTANGCAGTQIVALVVNPYTDPGSLSGPGTVCEGVTITVSATVAGGTWSTITGNASVVAGTVTGITTGVDTVVYTITDPCGTYVTVLPITVQPAADCNNSVHSVSGTHTLLNIFPNPGDGTFTISLTSENDAPAEAIITDALGRELATYSFFSNQPAYMHINAPAGIYLLAVIFNNEHYKTRLIIE